MLADAACALFQSARLVLSRTRGGRRKTPFPEGDAIYALIAGRMETLVLRDCGYEEEKSQRSITREAQSAGA
jgi:hypothetical protein